MNMQQEDLQFLTIPKILKQSVSIPKQSPKIFYFIGLILIWPLSLAILAQSLFINQFFSQLLISIRGSHFDIPVWAKILTVQFFYINFLFIFSLLSTAAVVFTVASLYTSRTVYFSSAISAIPSAFKKLMITFLWVLMLVLINLVFAGFLIFIIFIVVTDSIPVFLSSIGVVFVILLDVHVYIISLWHLASVVSVLEPVYGYAAMKKSYELLKGRTLMAFVLVFVYLTLCWVINGVFATIVINGGEDYGVPVRCVAGGFLVAMLGIVNLVGLLVQSVFYYVCKSYHNQGIDKNLLYDHLGGYLGEYVPLKRTVQMENLNA